jgi:cytochrome b pre-mRNA-processing protein 3
MATPGIEAERTPTAGGRNVVAGVLIGLLVVAMAAALLWNLGAERRAIAQMDPAERGALYERTLAELQVICGSGPRADALEKHCRTQVEFILKFPECDATCQAIARRHAPRPTK